jgi:hypothetical protein
LRIRRFKRAHESTLWHRSHLGGGVRVRSQALIQALYTDFHALHYKKSNAAGTHLLSFIRFSRL